MKIANYIVIIALASVGVNYALGSFFFWYDSGAIFIWLLILVILIIDLLIILKPKALAHSLGIADEAVLKTKYMVYLSLPFILPLVWWGLFGV